MTILGFAQLSLGSLRGTPQPHFFLLRVGLNGPMPHTRNEKRGYWEPPPDLLHRPILVLFWPGYYLILLWGFKRPIPTCFRAILRGEEDLAAKQKTSCSKLYHQIS